MTYVVHPKKNDSGQHVKIHEPSLCTSAAAWGDIRTVATVTPGGDMPAELSGCRFTTWGCLPQCATDWEVLGNATRFEEPPFKLQPGKAAAAGTVIFEPDCRVWVVSPCNAFGGYKNTFPKGRVEGGLSMRASAVKESFEEAGLKVELTAYLCDAIRHTTVTRYYLARRVGGNPADMGWESQAVHLVPLAQLASFVNHLNDRPIVKATTHALSVK
jgi:ADP-ribose pyrophosphatase YjhB (NUDIX family)